MSLATIFHQTRRSLTSAPSAAAYEQWRLRQPQLSPYASTEDLLAVARLGSPLSAEARDPLLVALLTELRRTKHTVWQSLLVLACEPMLVRVRRRLGDPKTVRFGRSMADDLDQRVFMAFLEAAHSLSVMSYAARVLRLALERRVFADQRVEHSAFETDEFIEDTYCLDPFEVTAREKAAVAEVARIIEAEGGEELRDAILATRGTDETLRDYVERTYSGRPRAECESAYHRLLRARRKVEETLRAKSERRPHNRIA